MWVRCRRRIDGQVKWLADENADDDDNGINDVFDEVIEKS